MTGTTRVLIVEDNPVFLKGLKGLLEYEKDIQICGITDTVAEAMRLVHEQHPDIVLADISLGGDNGFSLLNGMTSGENSIPVIMLSMHDEQFFADRAMKSGARGYVSKQDAPETIVKAIREVLAGRKFLSETVSRRVR